MNERFEPELPTVYKRKKESAPGVSFLKLVFLGVLALGAAGVLVWSMRTVVFETEKRDELFRELIQGKVETKRLVASEWARALAQGSDKHTPTEAQSLLLGKLLLTPDTPVTLRGPLAHLLGYSEGKSVAAEALQAYLKQADPVAESEGVLSALLALERLRAIDGLGERAQALMQTPQASVRQSLAFALGASTDAHTLEWLYVLLKDSELEVRHNAALALARRGDAEGAPVLVDILDQALTRGAELTTQDFELYMNALTVAKKLITLAPVRERVERIAASHAHLRLRQNAKLALQ